MIQTRVNSESAPRTFPHSIFRSPVEPPASNRAVLLIVDGYYAIGYYVRDQNAWAIENAESYPDQIVQFWAELPPKPTK